MKRSKGFSTRILHTAHIKKDKHNALHMPIYSNSSFAFETAEQIEAAFMGKSGDHSYSRSSNPTVENFEQRVRSMTGAMAVVALSSGMAAITNIFLTLASTGSNIVTTNHLFGGTFSLLDSTLKAFGVEARFIDLTDLQQVEQNIDENTCAIFFETITNPQLEVVDIEKIVQIAQAKNVPLVVDSTITPPNIFDAKSLGVNIEVVSSTKCFSGGATSIGGVIIDYGTFDWRKSKKLRPSFEKFGDFAFHAKLRKEVYRNVGACMSPNTAYLQSLGLETLKIRYDRAAENTLTLAKHLQTLPQIKNVNYAGLETSPFYEISQKQFGKYPSTILTFDFESKDKCYNFLNRLNIISIATNLSDNKTLIIHPASTIYCEYTPQVRASMNVSETMLRLSVGIEDLEDLIEDIEQAL